MLEERLKRTIALLGKEKAEKIFQSSVMVIGCGAVGGYALEMVARLGFGKIWVVDFDVFEESNINRQILALTTSIGRLKCEVAKERVLAINPEAKVIALNMKVAEDNLDFIAKENPDFVIDAIDDVKAKVALIKYLSCHQIKAVSAMGAALKTEPQCLHVATLDKTKGCHLAKKMRDMLKQQGVDLHRVRCVYSDEAVKICKDEYGNNILGSLPMVPMAMGSMLATEIFKRCCEDED